MSNPNVSIQLLRDRLENERGRKRMYRTAQFADPTLEPPRLPIVPAHVGRQELGKVTEDVDERRSLLVLRFLQVGLGRDQFRVLGSGRVANGDIYKRVVLAEAQSGSTLTRE